MSKLRGWSSLFVLVFLPACPLVGQTQPTAQVIAQVPSPLSIEVLPSFDLPTFGTASYFSVGGSLDLGVKYRLPGSLLTFSGGLEYCYAPSQATASLSIILPKIGIGVQIPLASFLSAFCRADVGYYFATYNDFSMNATDPFVAGGVGLRIALAPTFHIEVGGRYKYYAALYQGASVAVGVDIALGNLGGSVDIPTLELRPAFPVFYKHYDDHPIGTVTVASRLKVPATDVKAQVYIREFMDAPKAIPICSTLAPGESRTVDLYALFTDKVLEVTEGTKVAAEITVSYMVEGQGYEDKKVETLSVLGRNAMTWDDNRKAAAFVSAKEPQVLNFARSVTSEVRAKEDRSIPGNLQAAMALHEALDLYGINYTPNPVTPYSEASRQITVVDFLQFPRETFQYKAGDCSDLSILYSALLQAVGIDAAFITIPGHIFVAVNTGLPVEKAADSLIPQGQLIAYKGKAWIPVEITIRHQGFMKAWRLGAKEWNENTLTGQAGFYPVQDAWSVYQPVGLPGVGSAIAVPRSDQILSAYLREAQSFIDDQLAPQVARLQGEIDATGNMSVMNNLGVLYAKYGRRDKAEEIFKQVLQKKTYLPSLLNLGNLHFLKEDWAGALAYYLQADEMMPDTPRVLVALARANRELKNYPEAEKNYGKLKEIDPALAAQYAYLGTGSPSETRAADMATERRNVLWDTVE